MEAIWGRPQVISTNETAIIIIIIIIINRTTYQIELESNIERLGEALSSVLSEIKVHVLQILLPFIPPFPPSLSLPLYRIILSLVHSMNLSVRHKLLTIIQLLSVQWVIHAHTHTHTHYFVIINYSL